MKIEDNMQAKIMLSIDDTIVDNVYENNKIIGTMKRNFINGKLNGYTTWYDLQGKITEEIFYIKNTPMF